MSEREIIDQPDGPPIHLWRNPGGDTWACVASDHGPLCRLCQPVDETLAALIENVRDGNMIARAQADGQFEFKMTAQGNRKVENQIATDPAAAEFYARVSTAEGQVDLNPVAEKILIALSENRDDGFNIARLMETTGYTEGQVRGALDTLASVGFIEAPE